MNFETLFKGKKITLMGLGLLGRGLGDAEFLAKNGAQLTVTDLKTEKDLATSIEALKSFKNIRYVLGEHRLEDFRPDHTDMVVKAAGVPLNSPFIAEAQKTGVPVYMSTELFARYTEATVVGVTGTRGKSTVSYLLNEILVEHVISPLGIKQKMGRIFLGGNIFGVSTIKFLKYVEFGDIAVLELDSWQLQGFTDFSPRVAIFTTFMPDHMNYYANDLEKYFADKANIYRSQNEEDTLIVSEQVLEYIKKFGPEPKGKVIVARAPDVPDSWKPKIIGEHNRLNIALAMAAAKVFGVPEKTIKRAVEKFKPAPGRLERIRTYKGIEMYNDTNGTTAEATAAALKAFPDGEKTVLIFGGADKKLDPAALLELLPERIKAGVVLPGTGTDMIRSKLEEISQAKNIPMIFVTSMPEAVEKALEFAKKGDQIVMSPAFASFGLFKNEYDRGDQFNAEIKKL